MEIQCSTQLTLRSSLLKDAKMNRIALFIVRALGLVAFSNGAIPDEKPFVQPNQKMVIMDAVQGKVLGTAEIGKGSDGCVFDPSNQYAYSSNGDGTISVVGEKETGKMETLGSIPTQSGARTMTIDPVTHRLYLSAATPAPVAADASPGQGRRNYVPGSFVIIVVE